MELSSPLDVTLLLWASCRTTMGILVHCILLVVTTLLCWNVQMVEWECLCISVCTCKMNWPALLSTLMVLMVAVLLLLLGSMQRVKNGRSFDGALVRLLAVYSPEDENSTVRRLYHRNHGCAVCKIVQLACNTDS